MGSWDNTISSWDEENEVALSFVTEATIFVFIITSLIIRELNTEIFFLYFLTSVCLLGDEEQDEVDSFSDAHEAIEIVKTYTSYFSDVIMSDEFIDFYKTAESHQNNILSTTLDLYSYIEVTKIRDYLGEEIENVSPTYSEFLSEFQFYCWMKNCEFVDKNWINNSIFIKNKISWDIVSISFFDQIAHENHLYLLKDSTNWEIKKKINELPKKLTLINMRFVSGETKKQGLLRKKAILAKRYYLNRFAADYIQEGLYGYRFYDFMEFVKYDFYDIYKNLLFYDDNNFIEMQEYKNQYEKSEEQLSFLINYENFFNQNSSIDFDLMLEFFDIRESNSLLHESYYFNINNSKIPKRLNNFYLGEIYSFNKKTSYFNLSFIKLPKI